MSSIIKMVRAILKNYRQSPRKVRLVADLVRGKKVSRALSSLDYLTKKASQPVRSVINMAVANASTISGVDFQRLIIKEIRVDEGTTFKRFMPRARGSAAPIKKKSCHITVVLDENPV